MNCAGIGKTTLAHEICLQWARDGFLADEFDAVYSHIIEVSTGEVT